MKRYVIKRIKDGKYRRFGNAFRVTRFVVDINDASLLCCKPEYINRGEIAVEVEIKEKQRRRAGR